MNYTTSSGFSDLNGTMVAANDNVSSYYSTNLQMNGTVTNTGGSGLDFNVSFATSPPRVYHINSNVNGNGTGFTGNATNNGPQGDQQSWEATGTTAEETTTKAAC